MANRVGSRLGFVCSAVLGVVAMTGCSSSSTTGSNVTATPSLSPGGGTYSTSQNVTISDGTPGAVLYCTTDGTTPSASSPQCSQPTKVFQSEFLQAIAVAPGKIPSAIASGGYTINLSAAATPTFSPAGGAYASSQSVTISDAVSGANIYYTVDGSVPTASSTLYTGPVTVPSSETINAIAVASGYGNSGVASAIYSINSVALPAFSVPSGAYASSQTVSITDATANATIYYAINSAPSASSTAYSGPITVSQSEVINAIAILGTDSSAISSAAYAIQSGGSSEPKPTFTPGSGAVLPVGEVVHIADTDASASIYYTTDGSTPTSSSTQYNATTGLTLSTAGSVTVQAIAVDNGASSAVGSAAYTVSAGSPGVSISGTVMSGAKPVSGAAVQLYAAEPAGYGASALALGSPVTTDGSGAFSVTGYTCLGSPGDQVYVVATSGSTSSGSNSALELMTVLGSCGSLSSSSSFVVNEASTVASAYALSAFMTTAPMTGTSPGNYQGLANAFATVNNLVDVSKGTALSITPGYAANPVPYLNSSTAPQARVDTLANILNACVDSTGSTSSGCSSLFSASTPPSPGTAPSNTLQAALNIAQNPGNNVSTLFGLASSSGPFQPELTAAPNDWTLALTFTGGGLGISPSTSGTDSAGDSVGPVLSTSLAIDATGNIWVAGFAETGYPTYTVGLSQVLPILAEFNNLGAPQTPATTVSNDATPKIGFGGYTLGLTGNAGIGLSTLAIDQSGNVWVGDLSSAGNIYVVGPNVSASPPPAPLATMIGGHVIYSMAVDATNNVWTGDEGLLAEFTYNNSLTEPISNSGQSSADPNSYGILTGLAFDTNANLWGSDYKIPTNVYQISTSDGTVVADLYPSAQGGASSQAISLAADNAGNIYGCADPIGTTLDIFNATAATTTVDLSKQVNGTRGCGEQLLLDGRGHFFAISNGLGFPSGATIDEFATSSGTATAISPANGYTGTSSTEPPTITIDSNLVSGINYAPTTGAIDGSGNLWLLNIDTNNNGSTNGGAATGNVLVEFVGIAAPVVTPTSLALQNGQLGTRP